MKKKSRLTFKGIMLLSVIVPITLSLVVLGIVSIVVASNSLEENTESQLKTACIAAREYYDYELHNGLGPGEFIEYDAEYVDEIATTGVDLTIFKEDVRFVTSIKDGSGKRIEGTKSSPEVWEAAKAGKEFFSDNITINNLPYYGYYIPLYDVNKNVIGMAFAGTTREKVNATERGMMMLIIIAGGIIEVVFILLALLVAGKIAGRLKAVADGIASIADGKVDTKINVGSSVRETTMLIESADKLSNVLGDSIAKIREEADALKETIAMSSSLANESADGTKRITESMSGLSQTTETMAESVQEINVNVMSMGDMIDHAVDNTTNLNASTEKMTAANNEASQCIRNMTESSRRSLEAIGTIAEKIEATNNSIEKIDEMMNLISSIAAQTNLLALNASIEAARAGEAGRGFAVVAEEIKDLADQSNRSAVKIKDVVSQISGQSEECVSESRTVKEIIEEQRKLLDTTLDKFNILDNEIKSSVTEIEAVTNITEELNKIKSVILGAVSDLSAISEETAATNVEVSNSIDTIADNVHKVSEDSRYMNELSDGLKEAISYFK